jgi:YD repeat-containing protein
MHNKICRSVEPDGPGGVLKPYGCRERLSYDSRGRRRGHRRAGGNRDRDRAATVTVPFGLTAAATAPRSHT